MKRIVVAMAAIAALASPALAGTESFTHTTQSRTAPFTDNFSLASFDTTLGTLTSIELILSTSSAAEVDIFNTTGTSQPFTNGNSAVPVTVTGPAGVTTTQNLLAGPLNGSALPSPPPNVFGGLTGRATSNAFVPTADFAAYQAPPSISNLSFTVTGGQGSYGGTAAPGVFFNGSASVSGTTEIIYTYTDAPPPPPPPPPSVPEPAALTIFGLGMVGLGMLRRRPG